MFLLLLHTWLFPSICVVMSVILIPSFVMFMEIVLTLPDDGRLFPSLYLHIYLDLKLNL